MVAVALQVSPVAGLVAVAVMVLVGWDGIIRVMLNDPSAIVCTVVWTKIVALSASVTAHLMPLVCRRMSTPQSTLMDVLVSRCTCKE